MRIEISEDVDLSVDEILAEMDKDERLEMYEALADEFTEPQSKMDLDVAEYMSNMTSFEKKKIICNALGVGNYYDTDKLREALEPIITAH